MSYEAEENNVNIVGVSIPFWDLDWSYDNQPEEGVEQIDRKVNFGINYNW